MRVRNIHPHGAQRIPALDIAEWPVGEVRDIPDSHAESLIAGGDYELETPVTAPAGPEPVVPVTEEV